MSKLCDKVDLFADGELPAGEEADEFRDHLATCARCQTELHDILQLQALGAMAASAPIQIARPATSLAWYRNRRTVVVAAAPLLAAAAAFALFVRTQAADVTLTEAPVRAIEGRLSYGAADRFRPYDVARGAGDSERPPLKLLATLEDRGDWQGVAAAYLLVGDREQAAAYLERAPKTPAVDNDRAVLALSRGDAEGAVALLDRVLVAEPKRAQAMWNRGLALRELGLTAMAGEAFAAVAALGERGWSEEAAHRADALKKEVADRRAGWDATLAAGAKMIQGGPAMPPELARAHPSMARHDLYQALRSAGSKERALALMPMAEEIDRVDGGHELTAYAQSVAAMDFAKRAPFAAAYAELAAGRILDGAGREALLERLRRSGQRDLLLGAIHTMGLVGAHLDEFRALAEGSHDRGFVAIAEEESAAAERDRGDTLAAEARLVRAILACDKGGQIEFRCNMFQLDLARLAADMHRVPDAREHALLAWQRSRKAGDRYLEGSLLVLFGRIHRLDEHHGLAAAYLGEELLREPGDQAVRASMHEALAAVAVDALHLAEARSELAAASRASRVLGRPGIEVLAALAHGGLGADEEKLAAESLSAARRVAGAGVKVALASLEGRLVLERDRARGQALLRQSIDESDKLPGDAEARRARAASYGALIIDAGKGGNFGDALGLFAAEAKVPLAERCVLGVAVEDERGLVVARDASGQAMGRFEAHRTEAHVDVAGFVPGDIVQALSSCPSVDVLARAPFEARPALLPASLAWSYDVARGAASPSSGAAHRVVVTGAMIGSQALSQMADASDIDVEAPGLVDATRADGALLLFESGKRALGAAEVRSAHLRRAPLVVLGAPQRPDRDDWTLPAAFLEAGARAVMATPPSLRAADTAPFFDAVRARAGAGATLAVALKDERLARLAKDPASWVQNVMLFQ